MVRQDIVGSNFSLKSLVEGPAESGRVRPGDLVVVHDEIEHQVIIVTELMEIRPRTQRGVDGPIVDDRKTVV